MTLARHPKAQLAEAGLLPKHHFGQNFLADHSICRRIAEHASPLGTQLVVEIGAGLGALTSALLQRAEQVVAIERDRDLVGPLRIQLASEIAQQRLVVVEDDAKTFDYLGAFCKSPQPRTLAGNLPYQLTGPLIRRSLEVAHLVTGCAFLVQLEVADRLAARPATDAYGALSVFLQARYSVRRQFVVRRGAFYPQPNVDSALVVLEPLAQPVTEETPLFRALVKAAFAQRRKKLRNAWSTIPTLTAEQLTRAAASVDISLDLRGEVLTVEQFSNMAKAADVYTTAEGA